MPNKSEQPKKIHIAKSFIQPNIDEDLDETVRIVVSLLKDKGKIGLNGFIRLVAVVGLFLFTNLILMIIAIVSFANTEMTNTQTIWLIATAVVGIVSTAFAFIKTYRYLILDVMKIAYSTLEGVLRKLCLRIVEVLIEKSKEQQQIHKEKIIKIINTYFSTQKVFLKFPGIIRKGLILILKKVPFYDFVMEFKEMILTGNTEEISNELYIKVDTFIVEEVLGSATMKWLFWLLPLNILIVSVIIVTFL